MLNKIVDLLLSEDDVNNQLAFQLLKGLDKNVDDLVEIIYDRIDEISMIYDGINDIIEYLLLDYEIASIFDKSGRIAWDHMEVYDKSCIRLFDVYDIDISSKEDIKQATIKCIKFILNRHKDGI